MQDTCNVHGNMAQNSSKRIVGDQITQRHGSISKSRSKQPCPPIFRIAQVIGSRHQQTGEYGKRAYQDLSWPIRRPVQEVKACQVARTGKTERRSASVKP